MTPTDYKIACAVWLALIAVGLFFYGRWGWRQMLVDDIRAQAKGRLALDFVFGVGTISVIGVILLTFWSVSVPH